MTGDSELALWSEQWQGETSPGEGTLPAGLRTKVERQTRNIRLAFALDVLVTIAMGGWTATWAVISRREDVAVLAAATWIFIAAAWAFVAFNLRGAWAPHELTSVEFMDISIRRCRARLRATVFGAFLWFVEVVFCLGWIDRNYGAPGALPIGVVCAATGLFLGLCVWYRRRQRSELANLEAMQIETVPGRKAFVLGKKRRKVMGRI